MIVRRVIVTALAGASVLAAGAANGADGAKAEGVALAGPSPRPYPSHARAASAVKGRVQGKHPHRVHRHRPRTVVRCQSDGTDQVDEIENDGEEPRHYVSPGSPAPAAGCPSVQQALGIANLLDGGHRTRPVRPVR
jgi:hypothetical protein